FGEVDTDDPSGARLLDPTRVEAVAAGQVQDRAACQVAQQREMIGDLAEDAERQSLGELVLPRETVVFGAHGRVLGLTPWADRGPGIGPAGARGARGRPGRAGCGAARDRRAPRAIRRGACA